MDIIAVFAIGMLIFAIGAMAGSRNEKKWDEKISRENKELAMQIAEELYKKFGKDVGH